MSVSKKNKRKQADVTTVARATGCTLLQITLNTSTAGEKGVPSSQNNCFEVTRCGIFNSFRNFVYLIHFNGVDLPLFTNGLN